MPAVREILYVVNDADFFLSHRLPLARTMADAGWQVHVATPESPAVETIVQQGMRHHPIRMSRRGINPLGEITAFRSLLALYRGLRPDLVHHVTIKPVFYGGIAARLARLPAVVNALTGLGYLYSHQSLKARLLRFVVGRGLRLALRHRNSRVIVQNPDDGEQLERAGIVARNRQVLIKGSGVDMQAFAPRPEPDGKPLLILASRMLWSKGVGEFVEAARLLNQRGTQARFVLAGASDSGNPAAIPQSQLESWHREGVVEWWGRCTDMPGVFAQANLVCLPSCYGEGVPKVLIEAAACGRAIVTTDIPGCREIVRDGENGLLVPPGESEALAEALLRLIADREVRLAMGRRGRAIAESEFSLEAVVASTMQLYRELCTG
ncbi:glycosyltransferase family 4 protein [endosymbiont of Ridgeia piscesae]|jgi:glycosyltransferase involved in cell wall biosynthesis|uniref:Glycosyltransferase involved in cell wall bisynthesis n=1 Tax=endosymbiont of Ridgeia piscesae TaxID=54398 RepID=A0A0T5YTL2_9GAMM|nr:glycosyltransferase family 4 protein [endosymbiont of Ridgeia piscesae]KRT53970.1 Glycosyltransferase involved in cell wall bisynthesis [endosymbiont of Ridgeia piscesae]KRT59318.1 Glycosyltransferase involved in cell wall bisynthesis [endosymbiont of Ridgeia piscesae]